MTTPAPLESGTGAMSSRPGSRSNRTAIDRRKSWGAGRPSLNVELYRNTARLHGPCVPSLLDLAGVPARMYDRALGCWTVPIQYADDVIAVAEHRERRVVSITEADR